MAYENKDIGALENARAWLDMAQAKWRLQTMQHRSRYNPKTGEYRQLPTRIRRFLNGTPVGMKTAVLAILKESAPYRSPVFDCETDEGLVYNPTNTFIRKDGVEHSTGGKDPTYTIIQDLLLDDGNRDSLAFGDESSCAQAGETEYRWDEPGVEDCPDGGQGVSYQVTDISRDRETDLFSYRIRKVQALTVHVAPHVESCDARRSVETETWDNVYGEPGAFRQDPVAGGSAPVVLPDPCAQPDGRTVKIDVYRNPDCTYRLTVQTTVSKVDSGISGSGAAYSVYRDQYKTTKSSKTFNAHARLSKDGVTFRDGVTTRYASERNEDGTWNNTVETEAEKGVAGSTVETSVSPRGRRTSRTDTNQGTAASGISTAYGSWKSTKTPGGLFTNEYVELERTRVPNLGMTCGRTAFMHTHETQGSADTVPAPGSAVDAPAPAGGLVTTWAFDTDADGFVTRRERKEQEITVQNAVRRVTRGWLGTTTGTTHRSVGAAAVDSALSDGGAPGTSAEARLTNGGLWDLDTQTFLPVGGRTLGLSCSKTVYQHVHETTESAVAVGAEADEAGGGVTRRRSYSVDPSTGAVTKRDETTQEQLVSLSRRSVRVTGKAKEISETTSNTPNLPDDPARPGRGMSWEKTPGGLYNVTVTETRPVTGSTGASCEKTAFLHVHSTTDTQQTLTLAHVDSAANGRYNDETWTLTDAGTWERRRTERSEVQQSLRVQNYADAFGSRVVTREFAAASENGSQGGARFSQGSLIKSVESEMTNGRAFNVSTTEEAPQEVDSGWLHCQRTVSNGLAAYNDFIVFRNATLAQVQSWLRDASSGSVGGYKGTGGSFSSDIRPQISPNRFGLWDGTISVNTTFTPKAWASGGSTKSDNWEMSVNERSVSFVPIGQGKLLRVVTTETHRRGGGVGQSSLRAKLAAGVIKGSQFAYHSGGQAYTYDLITKISTRGTVLSMPTGDQAATLWEH